MSVGTHMLLSILILWAVVMSTVMLFFPLRLLLFVRNSRMWMWYLKTVFNIRRESLESPAVVRVVRLQGGVALLFSLLALYVFFAPLVG